jgi:dCTP diphosphatase
MDENSTFGELKSAIRDFVHARNWEQFHTPKNLAMSITIEAAELMEHFQWLTPQESTDILANPQELAEIADELADVLIYCLSFANSTGIDISGAITRKMERNEYRFPPRADLGRKHHV